MKVDHAASGESDDHGASGTTVSFGFHGRAFVIAPRQHAPKLEEGNGAMLAARGEVVGSIDCEGEQHLIIMLPPEPALADQERGKLTDILTRRELEIVMCVADGKCDKQIARLLGISGYTVREHIRRTCAKLGVSRRAAIVSLVIRSLSGEGSR